MLPMLPITSIPRVHHLLLVLLPSIVFAGDSDRFNYYGTTERQSGAMDYGPDDWGKLNCLGGQNHDMNLCVSFSRRQWVVVVVCCKNLISKEEKKAKISCTVFRSSACTTKYISFFPINGTKKKYFSVRIC